MESVAAPCAPLHCCAGRCVVAPCIAAQRIVSKHMSQPARVPGSRICVLLHADEIVVCANVLGFSELGQQMAWLAASRPEESFHLHMLWHLESDESRFDGVRPKNVWVLRSPSSHHVKSEAPEGMEAVEFEVTFQVVQEDELDELAAAQSDGIIPVKYRKAEASYVGDAC